MNPRPATRSDVVLMLGFPCAKPHSGRILDWLFEDTRTGSHYQFRKICLICRANLADSTPQSVTRMAMHHIASHVDELDPNKTAAAKAIIGMTLSGIQGWDSRPMDASPAFLPSDMDRIRIVEAAKATVKDMFSDDDVAMVKRWKPPMMRGSRR